MKLNAAKIAEAEAWVEKNGLHPQPCGAMNFFGEERMHFRINEHFKIGAILDVTYFGEFAITPLLGVRYDF